MMARSSGRDLAEIFGYAPDDLSKSARVLWKLGACPFINGPCIKHNHDKSIIYGTCSVKGDGGDVVICPYRLYANNYQSVRDVARDAFDKGVPFKMYGEYIAKRGEIDECVVAIGQNSGKEIRLGNTLSMDWILAHIKDGELKDYAGIEVQSIDITGNYRDAWHAYHNLPRNPKAVIPQSGHGLNWANVHKRLIPQLIRKGLVYSRSSLVKRGLYFVVPDAVFKKFEAVLGDLPQVADARTDTITVFAYGLGAEVGAGQQRKLVMKRKSRFLLKDLSEKFISGATLPSGKDLDEAVKSMLQIS
jgi:hypothetical protein